MVSDELRIAEFINAEGLNPYSTGRWFLIGTMTADSDEEMLVLILILLEDGF